MRELFLIVRRRFDNQPVYSLHEDLMDAYTTMMSGFIGLSYSMMKDIIQASTEDQTNDALNITPTVERLDKFGWDRCCNDEEECYVFYIPEASTSVNFQQSYFGSCILESDEDSPLLVEPRFMIVMQDDKNNASVAMRKNLRDACVVQRAWVKCITEEEAAGHLPDALATIIKWNLERTGRALYNSTRGDREAYIFVLPGKNSFR